MTPTSQAEVNTALIRRVYKELFWDWDLASVDRWFSPDFHSSEMPSGIPRGPDGVRQFYATIRSSFPDLKYSVEDVIAEDDKVVVRWRWIATHTGSFRGLSPTGRHASLTGISLYKVVEGKLVQRWVEGNVLGLLLGLGAEVRAPNAQP